MICLKILLIPVIHIFSLWQPYLTAVIRSCRSAIHPQWWDNKGVTCLCSYKTYIVTCTTMQLHNCKEVHVSISFNTTSARLPTRYSLAKRSSHTECKVQMIFPCHWQPEGSQHSHLTKLKMRSCIIFWKRSIKRHFWTFRTELLWSDYLLEPEGFFNVCSLWAVMFYNS